MTLTFNATHTGDLARRLCNLADQMSKAEERNDFDGMLKFEHGIKSCAMELIATLDMHSDDLETAKRAIEHALNQIQSASKSMTEKKSDYTKRALRDQHIRLVYSHDT